MKKPIISGIQQVGVGNPDVHKTFKWYRQKLGMDVPVFDEAAEAALMLPYTGGTPKSRHAILAINMKGGGGLEIWQYVDREPHFPKFEVQLGDLGIFAAKFGSHDVNAAFGKLQLSGENILDKEALDPAKRNTFFLKDLYDNVIQIVPSNYTFKKTKSITGGVYGAIVGVSDIDKAREVYSDILGYSKVVYDKTGNFEDFSGVPGGHHKFRRVLLQEEKPRSGAFSKLLGPGEIELVQVLDREPRKIYENRYWGDPGYIHLCFDINGMAELKAICESKGYNFTADSSNSFDMGEAAGHFSYIEDPDGTLIEFVETHKVPIMKKIGWYLNLKKRDPSKALPNWMLSAMGWGRVKD